MSSDARSSHLRLVTPPNNLTKAPMLNVKSYTHDIVLRLKAAHMLSYNVRRIADEPANVVILGRRSLLHLGVESGDSRPSVSQQMW